MKRFVCSALTMAMLILLLAVPAFATFDVRTFTYEFADPYAVSVSDGNGSAVFRFVPYSMGIPTASTMMNVPTGGSGRVYAYIAYHCASARSKDSTTVSNGQMNCSVNLPLSDLGGVVYNITTKTSHYANLLVGGTRSYWEYTYVSSSHDPTITEVVSVGGDEVIAQ